jgi:hypothetical protein
MAHRKPYKLDNYKKEQWLEDYKKSGSFTNSCMSIKMSRASVYDALKRDSSFREKKEEIDELINDTVEGRLFALTKTNPTACIFWLCNRRHLKWKNLNETKHQFPNEVNEALDKIASVLKK